MKISIRHMMISIFLLAIMILVSTMGGLVYHGTRDILIDKLKEESLQTIDNAYHYFIENYIKENEKVLIKLLEDINADPIFEESNAINDHRKTWKIVQEYNSNISNIYVGTKDGNLYTEPHSQPPEGYDLHSRPWYKAAMENKGNISWCEPYLEYMKNEIVVSTSITIGNSDEPLGVLSIDTSLENLLEIINSINFGENSYSILVDKQGFLISHPDKEMIGKSIEKEDWFSQILTEDRGVTFHNASDKETFISYITIPETGWRLIAFIPRESLEKHILPIEEKVMLVGVIYLFVAIIISVLISGWATKKIKKLIDAMTEVENGNLDVECNFTSYNEFIDISHKFNNMVLTIRNLIHQQKEAEKELQILSSYDTLTKVYNRNYFERKIKELEDKNIKNIGIIVFDVDGLKLVNDTLGHDIGDRLLIKAADIMKDSIPQNAMLFRTGGDEFIAIISNTKEEDLKIIYDTINNKVHEYNKVTSDFSLSVSSGFAILGESSTDISDTLQEADNNMYKEKLRRSKSTRNAIVKTLMQTLKIKDFINEGHGERMENLIISFAEKIKYPKHKIDDLCLLAKFHDIGKVAISDNILFKKEALTNKEMEAIRQHSEIGYRIAISSPELNHIADWILKHHEWWNGEGYPLGLKEDEIPLECRILSIIDAYDAMTNNRPYRKAYSHFQALKELNAYSGIMFDPILVKKFIGVIEENRVSSS